MITTQQEEVLEEEEAHVLSRYYFGIGGVIFIGISGLILMWRKNSKASYEMILEAENLL